MWNADEWLHKIISEFNSYYFSQSYAECYAEYTAGSDMCCYQKSRPEYKFLGVSM